MIKQITVALIAASLFIVPATSASANDIVPPGNDHQTETPVPDATSLITTDIGSMTIKANQNGTLTVNGSFKITGTKQGNAPAPKVEVTLSETPGNVTLKNETVMNGAATWDYEFTVTSKPGSLSITAQGTDAKDFKVTRNVGAIKTDMSSWGGTLKKSAGKSWKKTLTISPAFGRKVYLQKKVNGEWTNVSQKVTKKNAAKSKVTFTFSKKHKNWTWEKSSKWRIYAPATDIASAAKTKTFTLKVKAAYAPAKKYVQPIINHPGVPKAGYNLTPGMNGVKVSKVQRRLGMGATWETMNPATINKVRAFQRSHGLKANGVVDKKTWVTMGFSAKSWTTLDNYQHKVVLGYGATKKDRIETMIKTAYTYQGKKSHYVWGGAGVPADGADCSGMILQALYAAGINPRPITHVKHSLPEYRSSKELYKAKFQHDSLRNKKRGDIIFYSHNGNPSGIHHVAIYLGGGKIFDFQESGAKVRNINEGGRVLGTVARPFS